jgi:hypothetical protein
MAASIKGVQPLKFGTTTTTGYVVDSYTGDETTQELVIEDEGGDIITQILGFGNKDEITVEVIPKTATSRPTMGVLLTIGGTALNVLACSRKQMKKDVEKWTIKGTVYPGVTPA